MEKFLEMFHLVQGGRRWYEMENSQGILILVPPREPPKDIFTCFASNGTVKKGILWYQMEISQGIFKWGRGWDMVYGMKMGRGGVRRKTTFSNVEIEQSGP